MLKLTGGAHRGRSLKWLDTPTIRPTPARVREAVFNILADQVDESCWWDLCCGSGVVGFEALSRGAGKVVFVDQNRRSLQLLKDNLIKFELKDRAEIFCMDALRWLKRRDGIDARFIYCDPPYESRLYQPLLDCLGQLPLTDGPVTLILEYRKARQNWQPQAPWILSDERQYGDTCLALLEREEA
ncbi:MAG: 16S rRNA (guanine(966)-N(2))-methyltransferase RsmD [Candidatus Sericytochromatia bacterium]